MMTTAGVGAGGTSGMLRARRRDVSIKPNRKLDRKSSRGMIYENEELRLRTIHINAEVEQGQNDIKKLRRENEQLRREIWCLREEYDKLEEILKSQKSREDSENDEDFTDNASTSCSEEEDDDDEEEEEEEEEEEGEGEGGREGGGKNNKDDKKIESIQDELLENAENQKLSSEKINSLKRLHIEFDQLSTVAEEEETKKDKGGNREKDERELIKPDKTDTNEIVDKKEAKYLTGHAFNWIYSPECPVLPSVSDQSVYCPPSPSIQRLINNGGTQVSRGIGWETIFDVKSCADSGSTVLPEGVTPSSSSENTGSTVVQKTSPDIYVSGAVPSQLQNSASSDNLLLNVRDNLAKSFSHSCQELKSNLFKEENTIKGGIASKSLPDNSTDSPRAFRSQLKVRLNPPSEIPPQMPKLDCTPCQPSLDSDRRHRRFFRQIQLNDYQATSFEHPNPKSLTLPVSSLNSFSPRSSNKIYRDVGYLPVWPDVQPPPPPPLPPPLPRVNTQTQTLSPSPTPSGSSEQDGRKDDGKDSSKSSKSSTTKKKTRKKSERISSTLSVEGQKKQKNCRNSQVSKRRASSKSQSVIDLDMKNIKDTTISGGIEAQKEHRKNSTGSEKVPWCACWGNGCV